MRKAKKWMTVCLAIAAVFSLGFSFVGDVNAVTKSKDVSTKALQTGHSKILYSTYDPELDKSQLHLMNQDGTNKQAIVADGGTGDISPDGKSLLFVRYGGIWKKFLSDGAENRLTGVTDTVYFGPKWAPDGKGFLYYKNNGFDIYMRTENGTETNLTNSPGKTEWNADFSPNGRKIAYDDDDGYIYVMNLSNKQKKKITKTTNYTFLDWSPDGKKVLFTDGKDLYSVNIDGTRLMKLTDFSSVGGGDLYAGAWSPDGKTLAVTRYVEGDSSKTGIYTVPVTGNMSQIKQISNQIWATVCDWANIQ